MCLHKLAMRTQVGRVVTMLPDMLAVVANMGVVVWAGIPPPKTDVYFLCQLLSSSLFATCG